MTADQCLDHPWLKQTPKKSQMTVNDTKTVENVKSPSIEIVSPNLNRIHYIRLFENIYCFSMMSSKMVTSRWCHLKKI